MTIDQTHVFVDVPFEGFVHAGILRMESEDGALRSCIFRYDPTYASDSSSIAIDPLWMPLPDDPHDAPDIELLRNGDFAGALRDASPDGYGRSVLSAAAGRDGLDEFAYLVGSGSHRVGALAFGPTAEGPSMPARPDDADIGILLEGHLAGERGDASADAFLRSLDRASSFGGARPKAAVSLDGREWLAKFPKKGDAYDAGRTEHAVMSLARAAGFDVPDVRLETVGGTTVFLIERFDRVAGDHAHRLRFASAMSLTGETETTARHGSYEAIAQAVRRFGSIRDVPEIHRRALFNVLVGNDDDHLRNHGFLHDPLQDEWRLSPLYDVSPRPMLSTERRLAISFLADRELRDATVANVVGSAERFGISAEDAGATATDMAGFVSANWERFLRDSGLGAEDVRRTASCFLRADLPTSPSFRT